MMIHSTYNERAAVFTSNAIGGTANKPALVHVIFRAFTITHGADVVVDWP